MDAEPTAGVAGRPIREWHAVAAEEKAASVLRLLAGRRIDTVVDVGCGTGVVLQALDRQGFAGRYWACEPTPALHSEIPPIDRLVAAENTTFDQAFPGQGFDLAILSHVAEHLLTPAVLIGELLERARFVLVEVPIENNLAGKTRVRVRELQGGSSLLRVGNTEIATSALTAEPRTPLCQRSRRPAKNRLRAYRERRPNSGSVLVVGSK